MNLKDWYNLQKGDIIFSKKGKRKRRVISVRVTRGGSKCIELESGAVYCTGERLLFNI